MARDDCGLVAGPRCACRFVYSNRQSRRTGADECSAAPCLLRCRACRLHAAWTGRRKPGRIFGDTFLRGCLRDHTRRCVRSRRSGARAKLVATILKIFSGLAARAPLLAGCMAVFMLSLAGNTSVGRIFSESFICSALRCALVEIMACSG